MKKVLVQVNMEIKEIFLNIQANSLPCDSRSQHVLVQCTLHKYLKYIKDAVVWYPRQNGVFAHLSFQILFLQSIFPIIQWESLNSLDVGIMQKATHGQFSALKKFRLIYISYIIYKFRETKSSSFTIRVYQILCSVVFLYN